MSLYLGTSPVANTGYNKANTDLSNLTSTGKNIANWSNNVTNCITEIPQDIKLEINSSGKAVLKAGSKVIRPNGFETDGTTPKYDEIIIDADLTFAFTSSQTGQYMLCISGATGAGWAGTSSAASGTSTSSTTSFYYRTNDNKIYYQNNSSGYAWSFPIALVTLASGVGSIDQVFNGFGYIGSTVFALPGVKGLIPNGRNADGTLKNIEFTIDSVKTATRTWTWDLTNNPPYQFIAYVKYNNPDVNNTIWFYNHYIESKVKPTVYTYTFWYNPDTNIMYYNDQGSDYIQCQAIFLCNTWANGTTNVVEMWSRKSPFHALDYNDSSTISGWSAPSSRYIDLTLGASGATYTAPANGWYYLQKVTNDSSSYIKIYRDAYYYGVFNRSQVSTDSLDALLFCRKGDVIIVEYSVRGATRLFRFYYAEGESNV